MFFHRSGGEPFNLVKLRPMRAHFPSISNAELDVLKILWKRGPRTVREVHSGLHRQRRKWAYNTVLTLLSRLREKGYVASEKQSQALVFRPVVSRSELLRQRMMELADRVCDGAASPLVHALIEAQPLAQEDIESFRQLLERLENE